MAKEEKKGWQRITSATLNWEKLNETRICEMLKGIIALTDEDFSWNTSGFILNHHVKLYLSQLLEWKTASNGFRILMMRNISDGKLLSVGSCRSIVVQVKRRGSPVVCHPSRVVCINCLLNIGNERRRNNNGCQRWEYFTKTIKCVTCKSEAWEINNKTSSKQPFQLHFMS